MTPARGTRLPVVLFLATILTTLGAGSMMAGADPFRDPLALLEGVPFSASTLTINVCGVALAGTGSSFTAHLPSWPAWADLVWPANVTVMVVPGASQPQMGLACFCWRTMWSLMMAGSFNSARNAGASARTSAKSKENLPGRKRGRFTSVVCGTFKRSLFIRSPRLENRCSESR